MSFGVIKIIALDMVFNTRVDNSFVDKPKSKIISISNPTMESGMRILAHNFICRLDFFLWTHLHHPGVHFQPKV